MKIEIEFIPHVSVGCTSIGLLGSLSGPVLLVFWQSSMYHMSLGTEYQSANGVAEPAPEMVKEQDDELLEVQAAPQLPQNEGTLLS